MCDRWLESFENFYADMGDRPSDLHTLDREDNDGPYSPDNCRWATRREQSNNRRVCKSVEFDGRSQSIGEWARELGISYMTLWHALNKGMSMGEVVIFYKNASRNFSLPSSP